MFLFLFPDDLLMAVLAQVFNPTAELKDISTNQAKVETEIQPVKADVKISMCST